MPNMEIILANPRGFCAGVYMAIDVIDQLLDICPNQTIYVYHEIVHNRHVVERFIEKGVVFVEDIEETPEGAIVVFSAHGVSPQIREASKTRSLTTVDATCPLVTKVHAEAIRLAKKGFEILLIGHENHQEVVGTKGEAPDSIKVVESQEHARVIEVSENRPLAYLTQTTLSTDDAEKIIKELKIRFPHIKDPSSNSICYATTNRQRAVRALAPATDLTLVVGSQNSSNSVRLAEISQNVGTPAYLIEDASRIMPEWFDKHQVKKLLLTAGASAPEDLLREVIRLLIDRFGGHVEQHHVDHEDVEFGLPGTLKKLMRKQNIDPSKRTIRVNMSAEIDAWLEDQEIPHSTVDLTVGRSERK
jgi:4-hydroxy-3-methylbut-2-enyl diphosphate reductase